MTCSALVFNHVLSSQSTQKKIKKKSCLIMNFYFLTEEIRLIRNVTFLEFN